MSNEYDLIDLGIQQHIQLGRELYNAVTMRWVAMQINVSPDIVRYRLQKMRDEGMVDWNDMPGSLVMLKEITQPEAASTDESPLDVAPPSASGVMDPLEEAVADSQDQTPPPAKAPRAPKKTRSPVAPDPQ